MKTEMNKLLQLKHFFTVLQNGNSIKFYLKQPSQLLIKNIHANWLQYTHAKSIKHNLPVYLNGTTCKLDHVPSLYGTIKQHLQQCDENTPLEYINCALLKKSELNFDLIIPQEDGMQYFIQWQRYRKYWWSSISTTPGLFSVNNFRRENNTAHVDIVAQLPCGELPVENLSFQSNENEKTCHLTCSMCLEDALFILLLDGLTNDTKEEYLRLHRKIAPFKISFALDVKEDTYQKSVLSKLATLLHHKLESKMVSSWLPDFSLLLEQQIQENLSMGVNYTAVLEENTLKFGIFQLMNSSTKLMEQVHVAEFPTFAALIFKN